jgi:peroxiredoxin
MRAVSRATRLTIAVAAVLAVAYFVVTAWIRSHVDGLIQHSVGKPLPAFRITDQAGTEWTPDALRGKRALLHFFRSRCHSCDEEAPQYRELEASLAPDVVLLHVMTDVVLDVPPAETAATIAAKSFVRPIALADQAFTDAFHKSSWSQVTPITYVVDAAGVVRYGLRGAQTRAAIEQALTAAR